MDFDTSSPAVWRGGYNSGKIKATNNTWLDLEAGINRVAVRATRTPGVITVKVKGEGLKPASITLRCGVDPTKTTAGKYVKSFSYSGPTGNIHVESNAQNNPYADSEVNGLPERLLGVDFVQAAKADRACSAVDLMELAVPAGAVVTIAHDDRLPVPAWMSKLFEPTGETITVGGKPMGLFQHRAAAAESLTLGDNATGDAKNANTGPRLDARRGRPNPGY